MTEFYQFRDIVIRFDVYKDGRPIRAIYARAAVYAPDNSFVGYATTKVVGNEVRCLLKGSKVEQAGKYVFDCKVRVKDFGEFTHIVEEDVKKSPVPIKRQRKKKELSDATGSTEPNETTD